MFENYLRLVVGQKDKSYVDDIEPVVAKLMGSAAGPLDVADRG